MITAKDIVTEEMERDSIHFFEDEEWLAGPNEFEKEVAKCGYEERTVKRFPDYKISNYGDVISYRDGVPHRMATWTNQHGHKYTRLVDRRGRHVTVLVHRLVAEEFLPSVSEDYIGYYDVVRHLDDNPINNHVSNLAYGTQKDNIEDMRRNGHMYMMPVYCLELDSVFESCKEAGEYMGVNKSEITMNCRGDVHSVKGIHFCYLKDKDTKAWDMQVGVAKKPIIATNLLTGEELYFESRRDAAIGLGIPNCGISSVLTGHLRQTHNWTFREAEENR